MEKTKDKPVPCDICGSTYKNRKSMLNHRRNVHTEHYVKDMTAKCDICGSTYKNRKYMMNHKSRVHFYDNDPLMCDICGYQYNGRRNLLRHRRKDHQIFIKPPQNMPSKKLDSSTPKQNISTSSTSLEHLSVTTLYKSTNQTERRVSISPPKVDAQQKYFNAIKRCKPSFDLNQRFGQANQIFAKSTAGTEGKGTQDSSNSLVEVVEVDHTPSKYLSHKPLPLAYHRRPTEAFVAIHMMPDPDAISINDDMCSEAGDASAFFQNSRFLEIPHQLPTSMDKGANSRRLTNSATPVRKPYIKSNTASVNLRKTNDLNEVLLKNRPEENRETDASHGTKICYMGKKVKKVKKDDIRKGKRKKCKPVVGTRDDASMYSFSLKYSEEDDQLDKDVSVSNESIRDAGINSVVSDKSESSFTKDYSSCEIGDISTYSSPEKKPCKMMPRQGTVKSKRGLKKPFPTVRKLKTPSSLKRVKELKKRRAKLEEAAKSLMKSGSKITHVEKSQKADIDSVQGTDSSVIINHSATDNKGEEAISSSIPSSTIASPSGTLQTKEIKEVSRDSSVEKKLRGRSRKSTVSFQGKALQNDSVNLQTPDAGILNHGGLDLSVSNVEKSQKGYVDSVQGTDNSVNKGKEAIKSSIMSSTIVSSSETLQTKERKEVSRDSSVEKRLRGRPRKSTVSLQDSVNSQAPIGSNELGTQKEDSMKESKVTRSKTGLKKGVKRQQTKSKKLNDGCDLNTNEERMEVKENLQDNTNCVQDSVNLLESTSQMMDISVTDNISASEQNDTEASPAPTGKSPEISFRMNFCGIKCKVSEDLMLDKKITSQAVVKLKQIDLHFLTSEDMESELPVDCASDGLEKTTEIDEVDGTEVGMSVETLNHSGLDITVGTVEKIAISDALPEETEASIPMETEDFCPHVSSTPCSESPTDKTDASHRKILTRKALALQPEIQDETIVTENLEGNHVEQEGNPEQHSKDVSVDKNSLSSSNESVIPGMTKTQVVRTGKIVDNGLSKITSQNIFSSRILQKVDSPLQILRMFIPVMKEVKGLDLKMITKKAPSQKQQVVEVLDFRSEANKSPVMKDAAIDSEGNLSTSIEEHNTSAEVIHDTSPEEEEEVLHDNVGAEDMIVDQEITHDVTPDISEEVTITTDNGEVLAQEDGTDNVGNSGENTDTLVTHICVQCACEFESKDKLDHHTCSNKSPVKRSPRKPKPSSKKKEFQCKFCDLKYYRSSSLQSHLMSSHAGEELIHTSEMSASLQECTNSIIDTINEVVIKSSSMASEGKVHQDLEEILPESSSSHEHSNNPAESEGFDDTGPSDTADESPNHSLTTAKEEFTKDFILTKLHDIKPALQFSACRQIMSGLVSVKDVQMASENQDDVQLKRISENIWIVKNSSGKTKHEDFNTSIVSENSSVSVQGLNKCQNELDERVCGENTSVSNPGSVKSSCDLDEQACGKKDSYFTVKVALNPSLETDEVEEDDVTDNFAFNIERRKVKKPKLLEDCYVTSYPAKKILSKKEKEGKRNESGMTDFEKAIAVDEKVKMKRKKSKSVKPTLIERPKSTVSNRLSSAKTSTSDKKNAGDRKERKFSEEELKLHAIEAKAAPQSKTVMKILREKALEEKQREEAFQPTITELPTFSEILTATTKTVATREYTHGENQNLKRGVGNQVMNQEDFVTDAFDDIATGTDMDVNFDDVNMLCEQELFKDDAQVVKDALSAAQNFSDTRLTEELSNTNRSEDFLTQEQNTGYDASNFLDQIYGPKKSFTRSFRKTDRTLEKEKIEFKSPLFSNENQTGTQKINRNKVPVSKPKPDFDKLRQMLENTMAQSTMGHGLLSESSIQNKTDSIPEPDDSLTTASVFGTDPSKSDSVPKFSFLSRPTIQMKDDSKITVKATGEKQTNEDSCDIVYDQTINISTEDIPDSSSVKRVPYSVVKKSVPDSTTIDFSSSPLKVQVFTEGNDQSNKRLVTVKGAVQENDFDQASGAVSSSGFSVGSIASGSSTCSEENGESAPLEKEPCTTETNNPVNSDDSTKDSSHSRNEEAQSPKVSLEEESSKGSLEVHSHKLSQEDESPKICQEEMSPEENMNEQSPEERMEEKSPEERMEEQSPKESLEERSPSVDEDDKKSEDEEKSSSSEDSSDDSSDDDDSDNDKEEEQPEESDDADDEERGSPVTKETSETHDEHIVELQLFADSDDSFLEDEDDEISVTKIVNTEQKYQMEDKKEEMKNGNNGIQDNMNVEDMEVEDGTSDNNQINGSNGVAVNMPADQPNRVAVNMPNVPEDQMFGNPDISTIYDNTIPGAIDATDSTFTELQVMNYNPEVADNLDWQRICLLLIIPKGYCYHFIKGLKCTNVNCSYTHRFPSKEEVFFQGLRRLAEHANPPRSPHMRGRFPDKEKAFEVFRFLSTLDLVFPSETLTMLLHLSFSHCDVDCAFELLEYLCQGRIINEEISYKLLFLSSAYPKKHSESLWKLFEYCSSLGICLDEQHIKLLLRVFLVKVETDRLWKVLIHCNHIMDFTIPLTILTPAFQCMFKDTTKLQLAAVWLSSCDQILLRRLDIAILRRMRTVLMENNYIEHRNMLDSPISEKANCLLGVVVPDDDSQEDDGCYDNKVSSSEDVKSIINRLKGCFVSKNYTYMAEIFIDISTTQDCSNQCYIKALVDGFNSYHCLGKEVFYQKVEEFLKRVNMAYDNAKKKDELTKKSHRILGSLGNQLLRSCFNWGWCDVGYKMITLLKFHRIHYYKYNPQEASSPHIDVVTTEMCQKLDLVSEALQIIEGNGWHCLRNVNQDPDVLMCTIEILKVLMSHLLNKNRPAEVTRILLQLLQRKSDENVESCFSNINFTVFFEHVVKRSLAISDLFSARGAYNIYENCIGEQGLPVGLRRGLLSAWGTWYQTEGIQSLFDDLLEHNIYPTQVIEDSPRIIQIWTSLTLAEVKLILQDYLNSLYAFLCELLKEKRTKYLSEQDLSLGIKIVNKDSDPTVAPLGCLTPQNVLAMKSALITLLEEEFKPALIVANRYAAQYNPQQDFLCRIFSPSLLEYLQEIDKKKLKRGLLFSKEISNQVSSHTRRNNPTHRY